MNPNELNTEKEIESAFREAVDCFTPPAGLKKSVRERIRRCENSQGTTLPINVESRVRNRKGLIVKIVKWTIPATAACVAAALLIIALLPGPTLVQSAYAELAEAVRNSGSAEWVHYVEGQVQTWASLKPFHVIQKSAQGGVTFDDGDSYKSLRYDPEQNTIWIEDSTLNSNAKASASILDYIMSMINKDRDRGAVIEKSESTVNGKKLTFYTVSSADKKKWKKMAVDAEVKRVVWFEILEQGQRARYDFDYPSSGPEDIYAAGVPRDAKIVDVRTRDEQSSRLLAHAESAKERFDKTFRAIVCEGGVDDKTGKMQVDSITVYYQTPHQRRIDKWSTGQCRGAPSLNAESVRDLDRCMKTHRPSTVQMATPGGSVHYNLTHPTPGAAVLKYSIPYEPVRFQNRLWQTGTSRYGRSVPDVTGPNGRLLGTRNVQPARVYDGKVHELPVRWTVYLNPERDYIAEKFEQWVGDFGEDWLPPEEKRKRSLTRSKYAQEQEPVKRTTSVIEYNKTPSGHWCARKQLIETEGQDGESSKRMRIIHLDTAYKFPDGLFSPEMFEAQLKRPVKSN